MPELPYDIDALEPFMSKETLEYHYGKHHTGYVRKLNKQIEGTDYGNMELENIVKAAAGRSDNAVFNNAAQALNHEIFWNSLSPAKDHAPSDALRESLQRDFGGNDKFRHAFRQAALGLFGSGWVWLVSDCGNSENRNDRQCRLPDCRQPRSFADARCMGARLLPGCAERQSHLCRSIPGSTRQLAACQRSVPGPRQSSVNNPRQTTQRRSTMNSKDAYAKKTEAQMDEWAAEVKKLRAKAEQADADARIKMNEEIDKIQARQALASEKLEDLKASGEDAWEDIKLGLDQARRAVSDSMESARARFS